jgi:hypothetical protein
METTTTSWLEKEKKRRKPRTGRAPRSRTPTKKNHRFTTQVQENEFTTKIRCRGGGAGGSSVGELVAMELLMPPTTMEPPHARFG